MNSENQIITFTDTALAHIKRMQGKSANLAFRIAIKKTGCSGYAYLTDLVEHGYASDFEYEYKGLRVLIDNGCINLIKGTTVDFIDKGLGQTKLVFNNPNAGNLCGCGESFTIEKDE